jgi:hypothetical protein
MGLNIYTSIINRYDSLKDPEDINANYICYTDYKLKNESIWKQIIVKPKYDNTRSARYYKINSHKFFDELNIWIDGTYTVKKVPSADVINKWLGENDIAIRTHPKRNCIYEEAKVVKKMHKDRKNIVNKQIKKYKNEAYPKNNGMVNSSLIIRRNTKKVKKINEMWWNMVLNYSKRDQLSFNYVMWKLNYDYSYIPTKESNKYFNWRRKH